MQVRPCRRNKAQTVGARFLVAWCSHISRDIAWAGGRVGNRTCGLEVSSARWFTFHAVRHPYKGGGGDTQPRASALPDCGVHDVGLVRSKCCSDADPIQLPAHPLTRMKQIMLALTVASTSIVPQHQRGKLSGLFMTSESLGRFMGPASFSNLFAWSISPSAPGWVDHRFVFFLPAAIMAAVAALGWHTFTEETLARPPPPLKNETRGALGGGSAVVAGDAAAATDQDPAREAFVGSNPGAAARQGGVSPAAENLPRSQRQQQQQQGRGTLDAVV